MIFDSQVDPLTGDNKSDLNDSVTQLKQLVCNDDEVPANSKTARIPNESNTDNQQICCETCKIKPNSKKYNDMTRCTLCAVWFHDTCVGLGKDEPIGLWLCPTCRNIPQSLQIDVINLKDSVKHLKESTESILSAVQGLSTKVKFVLVE